MAGKIHRWRTKLLPVEGIFAFALFLMIAAPLRGEEYIPKFLPTVKATKLETNTANKVKKRVAKCEADGIGDIRKLTSPFEEFWAFIPGKCAWIELGILEEIRGGIRLDRYGKCRPPSTVSGIAKKDVIALIKETSDLVLYHPHPSNRSIVNHVIGAKGAKGAKGMGDQTATCRRQASTETLEAALPGIPDLSSLFIFSEIFFAMRPVGHFAERIVSVYGITEYTLTQRGKQAIANGDFARVRRGEMRRYFQARNRLGEGAYEASPSADTNTRRINRLLENLNPKDGLFRIMFMPFE